MYVSLVQSENTGVAPTEVMASAVALKLIAVVITSSPGFIPHAFKDMTRASDPFPTPTAYFTPQ